MQISTSIKHIPTTNTPFYVKKYRAFSEIKIVIQADIFSPHSTSRDEELEHLLYI
jgi:hypothetical protein